jgi:hypothetical protein
MLWVAFSRERRPVFQLFTIQELTLELWERFKTQVQRDGHTLTHAFFLMIRRYLEEADRPIKP